MSEVAEILSEDQIRYFLEQLAVKLLPEKARHIDTAAIVKSGKTGQSAIKALLEQKQQSRDRQEVTQTILSGLQSELEGKEYTRENLMEALLNVVPDISSKSVTLIAFETYEDALKFQGSKDWAKRIEVLPDAFTAPSFHQ